MAMNAISMNMPAEWMSGTAPVSRKAFVFISAAIGSHASPPGRRGAVGVRPARLVVAHPHVELDADPDRNGGESELHRQANLLRPVAAPPRIRLLEARHDSP